MVFGEALEAMPWGTNADLGRHDHMLLHRLGLIQTLMTTSSLGTLLRKVDIVPSKRTQGDEV